MSEIAKELQEKQETALNEKISIPDVKPNTDIDSEKADSIYDVITEDLKSEKSEKELDAEDVDLLTEIFECSIEDFTFEDLDLDLEDEELEGYLDFFDPKEWKTLDPLEKQLVIEGFGMYLAKMLDLKNPPKIAFYYGPQNEYGAYTRATNTIKINLNVIDSPQYNVIGTIAHETWHAYQWQRSEHPTTRKDALYAINFELYIKPSESFDLYQSQLVEAEANAFAQIFEERVGERSV